MTPKLAHRLALALLLLPFLYLGTASATYLYRSRAAEAARALRPLPPAAAATEDRRVVVIAPHPDDETLACGGLLQQCERAGAFAKVVFVTNGDGFGVAVKQFTRKLRVDAADHLRFGSYRQQEALAVTQALQFLTEGLEENAAHPRRQRL